MRSPFVALGLVVGLVSCNNMGEPWPVEPTECTGDHCDPVVEHTDMKPFVPGRGPDVVDLAIPDTDAPDMSMSHEHDPYHATYPAHCHRCHKGRK